MKYQLISAADVIAEPRDLFEKNVPRHLVGHCPHVVRHTEGGEGWSWIAERPKHAFGWGEDTPHWYYSELPPSAVDPVAHLAAMDVARIDAAVLFPLNLLDGIALLGPEMRRVVGHIYNEWVTGAVEPLAPDRLLAPRVLPVDEPWAAARELASQLDSGARAVLLPALPPPADPIWKAVWSELAGAGMTVCVPRSGGKSKEPLAELLALYPTLRIVVAPVDISDIDGADSVTTPMTAWLFDAEAPTGAAMYCADLPRHLPEAPSSTEQAARTASRAFQFGAPLGSARESAVRLRERLPVPRSEASSEADVALPSIGIALSNIVDEGPMRAGALADSARLLEEAGFAGLWVGDTVARRPNSLTLDPLVALALAAGATSRVELGTAVLQVPLRRTVELAHRALSLHELVPGRFILGVGAGSTQADFDAVGVPFADRFRCLNEAVPEMKALWRGDRVGSASLYSTPEARGGPPVLVGSWGGRWVERAAREFDGWIASGTRTWRSLADAMTRFRAAGGSRAIVSTVFADLSVEGEPLGDDDRIHLACSPEEAKHRLHRLAMMGFTDVIVFNHGPLDTLPELASLGRQPRAWRARRCRPLSEREKCLFVKVPEREVVPLALTGGTNHGHEHGEGTAVRTRLGHRGGNRLLSAVAATGLVGAALAVGGSYGAASASSGSTWTIGSIVTLTGENSAGLGVAKGVLLAWEKWTNAHGGINGHRVNVIVMDDQATSSVGLADAQTLIQGDHVMALVGSESQTTFAWGSYAKSQGVPIIGPGGAPAEELAGNQDFYPIGSTTGAASTHLEGLAADLLGGNRLGAVYCSEVAACQTVVSSLTQAASDNGIRFIKGIAISSSQPSYVAECLSLKDAGVNAVDLAVATTTALLFVNQCAQQGYHPIILGGSATISPEWATDPSFRLSGGTLDAFPWWDTSVPAIATFDQVLNKYDSGWKVSPVGASETWASIMDFEAAAIAGHLGNSPTSAQLSKALNNFHRVTLDGLAPPLTYQGGKRSVNCAWLFEVKGGHFNLLVDNGKVKGVVTSGELECA